MCMCLLLSLATPPAVFSVTPERKEEVTFVRPYYYSAGMGLYAPGGAVEGVETWSDLGGKAVATQQGYYGNEALEVRAGDALR